MLSIFGEEKDGGEDWQGLKPHDILEVFGGPAEAVPLLQNNIGYGFESNIVSKTKSNTVSKTTLFRNNIGC